MKKLIVYLFLCCMFVGCTSTSLPSQLPETMKEACALYQNVKPEVQRLRAYAEDNWNAIPPDIQRVLLKLDGYLPALDKAGATICSISGAVGVASSPVQTGNVQWDDVLATVIKAASIAVDLKAKGVI